MPWEGTSLTFSREFIMPRKPTGPRYWATKKGYYTVIKGERVCLAKGEKDDPAVKDEAERQYHSIMLVRKVQTDADRSSIRPLLDEFIEHVRLHKKPATYELWKRILRPFVEEHGHLAVRDLKKHVVTTF